MRLQSERENPIIWLNIVLDGECIRPTVRQYGHIQVGAPLSTRARIR
jgi:hypothetical protein